MVANFKSVSQDVFEETLKIRKNFNHGSWNLNREMKPGPSKYDPRVPPSCRWYDISKVTTKTRRRNCIKVTCKVVPVLNKLSTIPWRHVREWRCSSTILNHGTSCRWVVSFTPRPIYPHWRGGWVDPRAGLGAMEKIKILHCRELKAGRPARSLPLYRLSYPDSSKLHKCKL
jgi:hypothetical protein